MALFRYSLLWYQRSRVLFKLVDLPDPNQRHEKESKSKELLSYGDSDNTNFERLNTLIHSIFSYSSQLTRL